MARNTPPKGWVSKTPSYSDFVTYLALNVDPESIDGSILVAMLGDLFQVESSQVMLDIRTRIEGK